MRVHSAVWQFAKECGNIYAKDYAERRRNMGNEDRLKSDSRWLRGKGGLRLRKEWMNLSDCERRGLMEQCPDSSFPSATTGILDERRKRIRTPKSTDRPTRIDMDSNLDQVEADCTPTSQAHSNQHSQSAPHDQQLQDHLVRLRNARSAYHKTLTAEELLRVQTAYNNGDMTSLLRSTAAAVSRAVLQARSADGAITSDEAFVAVGQRLTRVFAGITGVTSFDPDPQPIMERPIAEFALARIENAERQYRKAAEASYKLWATLNREGDPDTPMLGENHKYFGKPPSVPPRSNYLDDV